MGELGLEPSRLQRAQEGGQLERDLEPRVVIERGHAGLDAGDQLGAEERPGVPVGRLADEGRHRHSQRQLRRELRQHRDLALEAGDRDLALRKAKGVALVHDPDAVVPPLGELA